MLNVKHEKYGIGEMSEPYVSNGTTLVKVKFACGEKQFVYPNKVLKEIKQTEINEKQGDERKEYIDNRSLERLREGRESRTWLNREFKVNFLLKKYIQDFNSKKDLPFVVKNSIPIVWFGNLDTYFNWYSPDYGEYKVVTVGLNPSLKEFPNEEKRFDTEIDFNDENCCEKLRNTLNKYFLNNPYKWFDKYKRLLGAIGATYYDIPECARAVHIDLYSAIATDPTWGKLTDEQKDQLMNVKLFKELLDFLAPNIILISVNKKIFNELFSDWTEVENYSFPGNNSITVKKKSDGQFVVNGTNMHGIPFGGINEFEVSVVLHKIRKEVDRYFGFDED